MGYLCDKTVLLDQLPKDIYRARERHGGGLGGPAITRPGDRTREFRCSQILRLQSTSADFHFGSSDFQGKRLRLVRDNRP
jgi:hypothetical protein